MIADGILVVGGRLLHSALSCKRPPILPRDHSISRLIVRECHGASHLGTEWTLSNLRMRYWIVGARNVIKQVRRQCMVCKRLYAAPLDQQMADLPPEWCLAGGTPFDVTGTDLFGPVLVKVNCVQVKRWGCIFTSFKSRAIHIEILSSLEADSFINGFICFVSRRGCPSKIYSDNETNFVGAQAEIARCLRQLNKAKVRSAARCKGVDWEFNTPLASHHGGVWERLIRSIRKILLALFHPHMTLTDEVLHTVLCECECIINGRPITNSSDDVNDWEALTTNHLLAMRGVASLPWGNFYTADAYRKRWRYVQYMATQFWKRWTREYLPLLQSRYKWFQVKPNVDVGDLVLIVDEPMPRGLWPLGIVEETKLGRDGMVRSETIRTKTSQFRRPITKLVHLEGNPVYKWSEVHCGYYVVWLLVIVFISVGRHFVVSHVWWQDQSLYRESCNGSYIVSLVMDPMSIAVSGCVEYLCFLLWGVLLPQWRQQSIVDQVWIWFCCYSFVVYGNMWIPLVWSFLWRLFIVELVFPVIVVIWVVPPGVAVSWAPCFEWGKTCFFMIGKDQVSSCLLELV